MTSYQEVRSSIKSGDLLFWSHRELKSWYDLKVQIVRMVTRSEYSHVGVAWVTGGRVFALEAVVPLIRIYPLSHYVRSTTCPRGSIGLRS